VSAAADPTPAPPDTGWERLERAAARAAAALAAWRSRAQEAEAEVARLRAALEQVSAAPADAAGGADELGRLRAENALLRSRTAEARRRVAALLARLAVLEARR
jgi:chromosome segregation ATPase